MIADKRQFSDDTKSTFRWIAAGIAIFGFVYLGRKIYKKMTAKQQVLKQPIKANTDKNTKVQTPTAQRLNTKMTQYSQFYFDKNQEIQLIQQTISETPTVEEIYLNSPLIAKDQFIKYTRQIRKRRRLIRKTNEEQYINTILTYQIQIKELLFRSRVQLLESLNMDPEVFQNMQQNYEAIQELRVLQIKSQQSLKSKLKTDTKRKLMSNQKLQLILQEQLHFIHNKMYDRLKNKLQKEVTTNQQQILFVVETLMEDIIYQKFGYEQEDIIRKIQQIKYDTKQLDEARNMLRMEIGGFHFQSQQSIDDPQQITNRINESIKTTGKTSHEDEGSH